jgi:hypothetical protein
MAEHIMVDIVWRSGRSGRAGERLSMHQARRALCLDSPAVLEKISKDEIIIEAKEIIDTLLNK